MNAFFIVCAIAALATVPTAQVQAIVAAAASTLFESIPFILAAAFARRLAPKCGETLAALLSCGCTRAAGARSVAVLGLTALTFGPLIAVARFIAALIVAHQLRNEDCASHRSPLAEVAALLPYAVVGSIATATIGQSLRMHLNAFAGAVLGAAIGFTAPCTLGAVALATTLRHVSMPVSIGILTIAGICNLRTLKRGAADEDRHDAFAYLIGAAACAALAESYGATLLNPRFTIALWVSAGALLTLTCIYRHQRHAALRWAPVLMAIGAFLSHASPLYTLTETTLSDAAPGDAINFRGVLARDAHQDALVRYAITCCRADAQPVAVRLEHPLGARAGEWIAAHGMLITASSGLVLRVQTFRKMDSPNDPFIYR